MKENKVIDLLFVENQISESQEVSPNAVKSCVFVIAGGGPVNGGDAIKCLSYEEFDTSNLNDVCIPCEQPCSDLLDANIYTLIDGELVHIYHIYGLPHSYNGSCLECPKDAKTLIPLD